jgi:predicted nucleic acid-binding protein
VRPTLTVLDASAIVALFTRQNGWEEVQQALESRYVYAPEIIDAEVLSALARHERHGNLSRHRARSLVGMLSLVPVRRIPHRVLITGAWKRRGNLSLYDALYVALAARIGGRILTKDRRMAASPNLDVPVTLLPA